MSQVIIKNQYLNAAIKTSTWNVENRENIKNLMV